jgi:hypothetical protein
MIKLNSIKSNPNNPRLIKDDKFAKLVNSIKEFPKMMALRPMVVNADNIVLGGNMRLKALKEAGYTEIPDEWVKKASDLTEEESRRFIIADNVGFGEHDWEMLANEWDSEELADWGLDVWQQPTDIDYSDKNQEIDTDFLDQKYSFKLEYSEDEYSLLKEKLENIGKTPESVFYDALISV